MLQNMIAVNTMKMTAEMNGSIVKKSTKKKKKKKVVSQKPRAKRRSKRSLQCGSCKGCTMKYDCGHCKYCLDKKKFGGPNKLRKRCMYRICERISSESSKITKADKKKRKLNPPKQQDNDDEAIAVAEPVKIPVRRAKKRPKLETTEQQKQREEETKKRQIQKSKLRYAAKYPPIKVENGECPLCFYKQVSSNGICVMCLTPLMTLNDDGDDDDDDE
eukprot:g1463.t1